MWISCWSSLDETTKQKKTEEAKEKKRKITQNEICE